MTRQEALEKIQKLGAEERAQLDRLEKDGRPEALELDPTEKDQFEKRAKDLEDAEAQLDKLIRFDERKDAAAKREERMRVTPIREPQGAAAKPGASQGVEEYRQYLRTGIETRVLQVGDNTKGGYLAPKEFVAEILKNETEMCPFRSLATVMQTNRQAVQIPRRTAQFTASWTAEQTTRTENTGLAFGMQEIPTHEMVAIVDVSNWMLEDSAFDVEGLITMEIGEQFGVAENTAFMTGNSIGKPWGVAADTAITYTASGGSADFDGDDLIDLLYGLKGIYQANATWLFNRVTQRKIRKLKANSEYIWSATDIYPNNISRGLSPTVLGRPYVIAPELADTGAADAISVIVGDFRRGYRIVDHVATQILRDPYTQSASGNVRFTARRRVGGQVVIGEAIRRLKEASS